MSMLDKLLRDRLVDAYVGAIPLITLNLLWFVVSLPVVTLIPATGALFYATHQLADIQSADWRTFFEGFRRYFWQSWGWGLLSVLLGLLIYSNLSYYSVSDEAWVLFARVIVMLVSIVAVAVQLYTLPVLFEQEKPSLRQAMRNSAVLLLKRPLSSLAVTVLVLGIAAASTFIVTAAWILISGSGCAFIANLGALNAIRTVTGKSAETEIDEIRADT